MSYFSTALAALMERNGRTQSELAKLTGRSQAHISRLLSDDQQRVSLEDLALLAVNVADDQYQRAELVRAHLLDERVGPGSELVEITISGETRHHTMSDTPPPLSPRLEKDFEILRRHGNNKALRVILDGLADLLKDEPVNSSPALAAAENQVAAAVKGEVSYRKLRKPLK